MRACVRACVRACMVHDIMLLEKTMKYFKVGVMSQMRPITLLYCFSQPHTCSFQNNLQLGRFAVGGGALVLF